MKLVEKFPLIVLFVLGLFSVGRGLFHYAMPDSGAGVVAGMDLTLGNGADVIFLLGAAGVLQAAIGAFYVYIVFYARQVLGFALGLEVVRSWALVLMEYTFKMPVNPVPGRYAHITVAVAALWGFVVYMYISRNDKKEDVHI